MGIEYKLVKLNKKEIYDLDKGNWAEIFPYQYNLFKIDRYICKKKINLKDEILKIFSHPSFDDEWADKIAKDIVDWCGKDFVIMVNDCDELYEEWNISTFYKEYKNTGNRFLNNEYLSEGVKVRYIESIKNKEDKEK